MRLSELEPVLKPGSLRFRCPVCRDHWIMVPLEGPGAWQSHGDSPDHLTIHPSIRAETRTSCLCHVHVRDGEVEVLPDSHS